MYLQKDKPFLKTASLLVVCILFGHLITAQPPASTNETGLLSDLWTSLTTVGKTASCPGECLHAITSIFCDNVLEEISCGESFLRCCVSQQVSHATPVETSPPIASTESTVESFSVISNNHNSSQATTQPPPPLEPTTIALVVNLEPITTTAITTTTSSSGLDLHYVNPTGNETEPETGRDSFIACPVECSKPSPNAFCVKPVRNAICSNSEEEECCLESESSFDQVDQLTKNLIKLVQQSVAMNETKNIGSELSALSTTIAPTTTLPSCDGTCVVSLFSLLCDEIDNNQFCPNGGSCCVNREPTAAPPQIAPCDGNCIPVILSGMCNKPFELVLKTVDCATGTICCADRKSDFVEETSISQEDDKDALAEPDSNVPTQYMSHPAVRPLHPPPTQLMPPHMPPNQFNQYNPNGYIPKPNPNVMPIPPMHPIHQKPKPTYGHRNKPQPQQIESVFHPNPGQPQLPDKSFMGQHLSSDQVNNNSPFIRPHIPENFESKPPEEIKPQVPSVATKPFTTEMFVPCPGNCMTTMFRFACFGTNSIYGNFHCAKGQVCCSPNSEIEKFEAFLQSNSHPPPNHQVINQANPSKATLVPPVRPEPIIPEIPIPILTTPEPTSAPHVCGVKGSRRTKRIVGGSDSYPGEWCWQVALVNQQNKYICGGALIGKQWVLTAAHCITNLIRKNEPIFVRVGEYDLTRNNKLGLKVITSYVHHNHNGQSLDNDIALLKLQSPVELNAETCLVCLPTRSTKRGPGKRCTVTGYGFEHESGPIALRIRQASVPIVEDQECSTRINLVTERLFILPVSSFCAGGEGGNDACQGDGGSGLVCESDGFYELAGLVSWGFGCGRNNVPGVYVKVSSFVGWINQIVSTNSN